MNQAIYIKNGFVVDPANNVFSKQDIMINDGKIVSIPKETPKNCTIIDAEGLVVSPGFIDIHMHEDSYDKTNDILENGISLAMLKMGVTTAVGGNCGSAVCEPNVYFDALEKHGSYINLALFAGHGDIRELVGQENKYSAASNEQIEKMAEIAEQYLDCGCVGVSFGIRYKPGINQAELNKMSEICAKKGKLISAHIRDDANAVFEAAKEFLDTAALSGASAQFSHIGSMGGYGQMEKLLEMVDRYKLNGVDVSCDCYPYYAFSTMIGETTYDDGFIERYDMDYSQIELCSGSYVGQRCTKEIFDYLRKNEPETITVAHVMKADDVDKAVLHPNVMVASDGFMKNGQGHPRACGTFPRFFRNYVISGKLNLFEAIRKVTQMPADKLGLFNKGRLSIGTDADITIFDLSEIKDNATFENPTLPPEGIKHVIIGGNLALRDCKVCNGKFGKALRK